MMKVFGFKFAFVFCAANSFGNYFIYVVCYMWPENTCQSVSYILRRPRCPAIGVLRARCTINWHS